MEFKSEIQKQVYEKIASYLRDLFGEMCRARADVPSFGLMHGSAFIQIHVFPWGADEATVCVRSYLVSGAEITPDLMKYLLTENAEMRFGAFAVDSDGDILFDHTIVGSTCDKPELKASVMAVALVADRYDDEIVQKWGGQRAIDRVR